METVTVGGLLEATYSYDARGLQVKRALANGQTFHMIHDFMGRRIADYQTVLGAPVLLVEYIWLEDRLVAAVINNGSASGFYNYIHSDHMNRPVAAFAGGANGPQSAGITYTPFGQTHALTGLAQPELGFPGQWFREESGLFQNWMRDYDPSLGAYIQPDPLGLVDGSAVYRYALGNPMRYFDPRGEYQRQLNWIAQLLTRLKVDRLLKPKKPRLMPAPVPPGFPNRPTGPIVPPANEDEDCCTPLYVEIDSLVDELKRRYHQYKEDKNSLAEYGRNSRSGHRQQYHNKQKRLRDVIQLAETRGCVYYRLDAWYWATLRIPGY